MQRPQTHQMPDSIAECIAYLLKLVDDVTTEGNSCVECGEENATGCGAGCWVQEMFNPLPSSVLTMIHQAQGGKA